jgi:hypothetical protein
LLKLSSGVASSISVGGGGYIHIFVFTDRKNEQFQKKLIMHKCTTRIYEYVPPTYRAGYATETIQKPKLRLIGQSYLYFEIRAYIATQFIFSGSSQDSYFFQQDVSRREF